MPSIEFDDDRPERSRDELLAQVRRDGLRLRYRRRAGVGGLAAVLVAALLAPAVLGTDGGDDGGKVVAIDQPTTTIQETTTTLVEVTATTVVDAPTTTAAPITTVPRTTTSLVCRNSFDERCGPFRWDPAPGPNQPATVTVTFSPERPVVGEQVTAHITVFDPDGPADSCGGRTDWGEGPRHWACSPPYCERQPHGPWTPPPREANTQQFDDTHTYNTAGTYTFVFSGSGIVSSGCDRPTNPYGGEKSGSATITVSPAPA